MQRGQSIHPYFDAKAPEYDRLSRRGLWSKVRAAEGRALARLLGPVNGTDLLDLGCGTGHYAARLRARGARVFGVDSSPNMIEELRRKGIEGRCADVSTLRLGRRFHVILAAGLVEFLERENCLFSVAKAHIHPGGRLVLLVPRVGLRGFIYELAHSWMGCRAVARSVAALEASALEQGWVLDSVRGAGPLAKALRFKERERG
jgi:SAM-dependent methyltransferase